MTPPIRVWHCAAGAQADPPPDAPQEPSATRGRGAARETFARREAEADAASQLRHVVRRLLAGEWWRPPTRGMLYELAARLQQTHPTDWEQRLAAAYLRALDGLAPADVPASPAEEQAFLERLQRYLAEDVPPDGRVA
jgi:hypothetical protein